MKIGEVVRLRGTELSCVVQRVFPDGRVIATMQLPTCSEEVRIEGDRLAFMPDDESPHFARLLIERERLRRYEHAGIRLN